MNDSPLAPDDLAADDEVVEDESPELGGHEPPGPPLELTPPFYVGLLGGLGLAVSFWLLPRGSSPRSARS